MKYLLFGTLFLTISLVSCKPEACIDASSNEVLVGEPVVFNSCSKRTSGVDWEYEVYDSYWGVQTEYEYESSFSHTYNHPGSYLVKLKAYSRDGLGVGNPTMAEMRINVVDKCYLCTKGSIVKRLCGSNVDPYFDSLDEEVKHHQEEGYSCQLY
ncbi:PKD domain-containing protein [bacterium SCSIO 12741]|nr:PKD domain-containing protein [bacterium SCSIO 12741]